MTITIAEARQVLRTSFRAAWVAAGEDPARVAYQNTTLDDVDELPYWARFSVIHAPLQNDELGGGTFFAVTRGGVVLVEIYVRLGETDQDSDRLAEIVSAWLEQYGVGFVEFQNPGVNDIGPAGGWYQTNGEAIFRYDTSRQVQ